MAYFSDLTMDPTLSSFIPSGVMTQVYFGKMTPGIMKKTLIVCKDATDQLMGPMNNDESCLTCGQDLYHCDGHAGAIKLPFPIYDPERTSLDKLAAILNALCTYCLKLKQSQIVLTGMQRMEFLKELGNPLICHHCKMPTQKYIVKHTHICIEQYTVGRTEAPSVYVNASTVLEILKNLVPSDLKILGYNNYELFDPTNLLYEYIPMRPNKSRIPVIQGNEAMTKHPLTVIYSSIFTYVARLEEDFKRNKCEYDMLATINEIQKCIQQLTGFGKVEKYTNARDRDSTMNKLISAKKGLLRDNQGRTTGHAARTVIAPSLDVPFENVVLPQKMRDVLTVPEIVCKYNIDYLQKIMNYGGIKTIRKGGEMSPITFLVPTSKNTTIPKELLKSIMTLEIGDSIERYLQYEKDYVALNRQPTLSKSSIMSSKVQFALDNRNTMSFCTVTCPPFNADFDGDEMNAHNPQTMVARVELKYIGCISQHMINEENSSAMMYPNGDAFLAAHFLLKDPLYDIPVDQFNYFLSKLQSKDQLWTLNRRIRDAGIRRYSGQALISAFLPEDFYYENGKIINGILIQPSLKSRDFGPNGITYQILIRYSAKRAVDLVNDIYHTLTEWLYYQGITFGINDMFVQDKKMRVYIKKAIVAAEKETMELELERHNDKDHMTSVKKIADQLTGNIEEILKDTLSMPKYKDNMMRTYAQTGKKAADNLGKLLGVIGQEAPPNLCMTNRQRYLPFFPPDRLSLQSLGCVTQNFVFGTSPSARFVCGISGRLPVLTRGLSTSTAGDIHNNMLTPILMGTQVSPDFTVRNTSQTIIQFLYGNDGLKVTNKIPIGRTTNAGNIVETAQSIIDVQHVMREINQGYGYDFENNYHPEQANFYEKKRLFFHERDSEKTIYSSFDLDYDEFVLCENGDVVEYNHPLEFTFNLPIFPKEWSLYYESLKKKLGFLDIEKTIALDAFISKLPFGEKIELNMSSIKRKIMVLKATSWRNILFEYRVLPILFNQYEHVSEKYHQHVKQLLIDNRKKEEHYLSKSMDYFKKKALSERAIERFVFDFYLHEIAETSLEKSVCIAEFFDYIADFNHHDKLTVEFETCLAHLKKKSQVDLCHNGSAFLDANQIFYHKKRLEEKYNSRIGQTIKPIRITFSQEAHEKINHLWRQSAIN